MSGSARETGFFTQEYELQRQQQLLIDAAVRAQVVIDSLDARGLTAPAPTMGAWNDPFLNDPSLDDWRMEQEVGGFSMRDSALWEIAESTGGEFFHDNNDLRSAFGSDIAGAAYYGLGFVPAAIKSDGAFHRLKVTVARPGLTVAARNGYFAPTPDPNQHSQAEWQELLEEVMGTDSARQIDVQVAAAPAAGGVHLTLRLDPNTLKFRREGGRHRANVTAIFALLSLAGRFVAGQRVELATQFRDATMKEVSHPGVGIPLGVDLHAAPGGYRLRVVVLDDVSDALTAISGKLDIAKSGDPR